MSKAKSTSDVKSDSLPEFKHKGRLVELFMKWDSRWALVKVEYVNGLEFEAEAIYIVNKWMKRDQGRRRARITKCEIVRKS